MTRLVIPPGSALHRRFAALIEEADIVVFAGLPGVGKSLLLQQLALMAGAADRPVSLAQWDVIRQPFETPRYPIVDGATHPQVIRAAGTWLRRKLAAWAAERGERDVLIGEAPLIGGRLMELARPLDDEAERLLRSGRTRFCIPAPSVTVRALIESRREQSIAQPRHENEAHDAPPDLLRALWQDLRKTALWLGLAEAGADDAPYSPAVYAAVYRHLLRHRRHQTLAIDQPLQPAGSVYAGADALPQLRPAPAEIAATWDEVEANSPPGRPWYEV